MSELAQEITDEEAAELNESLGADVDEPVDETSDVTEDPEAERQAVPQPASSVGDPDAFEKALKKLDAEKNRHTSRISEIMGDDALGLVPCELCWVAAPGFRWDRAPDEQTAAAVRVAIGMPDVSNFRASHTEAVCDNCGGLGKVRTGSSVPQFETAICDACAGKGYVGTRPRVNADQATAAAPLAENGAPPVYDDGIKRDMFGTPETDPDYNLMPGARARPTDYWQTHRE